MSVRYSTVLLCTRWYAYFYFFWVQYMCMYVDEHLTVYWSLSTRRTKPIYMNKYIGLIFPVDAFGLLCTSLSLFLPCGVVLCVS